MSSLKGDKMLCARLCHIVKWEDFDGYGFNLHAEKGKNGQFIGKVDDGSPSQAAGLRQGDRIVEVNEINIANESHKQVVERIKAFPNETKLLVVDQEADEYFRANNIIIKGTMANVKVIKTPEKNPYNTENDEEGSSESANSSTQEHEEKTTVSNETSDNERSTTMMGKVSTTSVATTDALSPTTDTTAATTTTMTTTTSTTTTAMTTTSVVNEKISDESGSQQMEMGWETGRENGNGNGIRSSNEETAAAAAAAAATQHATGNGNIAVVGGGVVGGGDSSSVGSGTGVGDGGSGATAIGENSAFTDSKQQGLNLKMSAKELRAQLAARKKYDPKKESIGFKDKFDIVQKL